MLILAYPWLLILLPLPWLVRALLPPGRRQHASLMVPFVDRLRQASGAGAVVMRAAGDRGRMVFKTVLWTVLIVTLARPQWLEPAVIREVPTRDLLLLVDLSTSMGQEDFTNAAGVKVDRLTAVKEVLGDFLVRRQGDRAGLVVFGESPFLQAPFTVDLELSRLLLEESAIGMAGPRTAFGDAIGLGVNLFRESDAPAKTMIVLTDGNDTASRVPPVEAARIAAQEGIRIHTVAIGDPATVGEEKLDEQTLRDVAETAGGSYFFGADRDGLAGIYRELDTIETRTVQTVSHRPRRDVYYWPLLMVLLLSMGEKGFAMLRIPPADRSTVQPKRVHVDHLTGRLEVEQ
jgi:Ca-activated chloride channel family protein